MNLINSYLTKQKVCQSGIVIVHGGLLEIARTVSLEHIFEQFEVEFLTYIAFTYKLKIHCRKVEN